MTKSKPTIYSSPVEFGFELKECLTLYNEDGSASVSVAMFEQLSDREVFWALWVHPEEETMLPFQHLIGKHFLMPLTLERFELFKRWVSSMPGIACGISLSEWIESYRPPEVPVSAESVPSSN